MDQTVKRKSNRTRKILVVLVVVCLLFFLTSCGNLEAPLASGKFKWHDYILVYPIGWLMGTISGFLGNNYGLGIIITTIIIRLISWPIYAKTSDMSLKMNLMQPEMQRIQVKYANRQDRESQQRMQMEMTQLYQRYNMNPLGCLLPILQMPIFLAVYQVVRRIHLPGGVWSEKVSNMNLLGINLAASGTGGDWRGWILAILVAGLNVLMVWLSMKKPSYQKETHKHGIQENQPGQNSMKIMQYIMIAMMFGFALSSNSIALYWIIGNAISILQTFINRKRNEKKYYKYKYEDLVVKNRD